VTVEAPAARQRASTALTPALRVRGLVHVLAAGLLGSVVSISLTVALAALIFGPGLQASLPAGIGVLLVGAAVMAAIGARRGALSGMVVGPQDAPASVLAAAGAALVAGDAAAPADALLALMIVTTLALGGALCLLGWFRLGRLVRFLPFPVMAGFMGGVGLSLVDGSLRLLLDGVAFDGLLAVDPMVRLLPGFALAGGLTLAFRSPGLGRRLLPLLLLGALVAVHLGRLLAGVDVAGAVERGWLLGPFPAGRMWSPDALAVLGRADWGAVASQAGTVAVLVVLVPIAVLLYTGALEEEFEQDLPADRELRTSGVANLVAGLAGSSPGYVHFSNSVLTTRVAMGHRGAGYVVAAMTLAAALVGGPLISLVPVPVVGGVLLFIGVQFLVDWLWATRRRVSVVELGVMASIAVATVAWGFLPAIAIGIALAVALFVVRYSRVRVVRTALTGQSRRSNVQRPLNEEEVLDREGDRILVLELEGFLFFGSAEGVLEPVRRRLTDGEVPLRSLVLDLHRVSGMDSTAVAALLKLFRLVNDHGVSITLCGVDPATRSRLGNLVGSGAAAPVRLAVDCDRALQHCEDEVLADHRLPGGGVASPFEAAFGEAAGALEPHFEVQRLPAGRRLLEQGAPSPGLYFLEAGRASILLADEDDGEGLRIRQLMAGTVVGEISYYLAGPCSASVVLDTDAVVRYLPHRTLASLSLVDPPAAVALHQAMARAMAQRLVQSNATVRDLLR
jgi:sulfate permease, SulP family